jgi:uncharacterized Zn-binding protein involved in type VI secretion
MPGAGRLGDKARATADAHGCPGCPHPVIGPAIRGSSDVFINNRPAVRVGDCGIHKACCGPGTWKATKGAPSVFINGKAAFRRDDSAQFCGAVGALDEGSADVIIGDAGAGSDESPAATPPDEDMHFVARFEDTGEVVANVKYRITLDSGEVISGRSDASGKSQVVKKKGGRAPRIALLDHDD